MSVLSVENFPVAVDVGFFVFVPGFRHLGKASVDHGNVVAGGMFGVARGLEDEGDPAAAVPALLDFNPETAQVGEFDAAQGFRGDFDDVLPDLQRCPDDAAPVVGEPNVGADGGKATHGAGFDAGGDHGHIHGRGVKESRERQEEDEDLFFHFYIP